MHITAIINQFNHSCHPISRMPPELEKTESRRAVNAVWHYIFEGGNQFADCPPPYTQKIHQEHDKFNCYS